MHVEFFWISNLATSVTLLTRKSNDFRYVRSFEGTWRCSSVIGQLFRNSFKIPIALALTSRANTRQWAHAISEVNDKALQSIRFRVESFLGNSILVPGRPIVRSADRPRLII